MHVSIWVPAMRVEEYWGGAAIRLRPKDAEARSCCKISMAGGGTRNRPKAGVCLLFLAMFGLVAKRRSPAASKLAARILLDRMKEDDSLDSVGGSKALDLPQLLCTQAVRGVILG